MTQKVKFQVIGRCVKMQKASLEDVIKMADGVPYAIDFFHDFSDVRISGQLIKDISAFDMIEAIINSQNGVATCAADVYTPSAEDYRRSQEFWERFDKHCEKERKREEKWNKRKSKPKNTKEAIKNFDRTVDRLLKG